MTHTLGHAAGASERRILGRRDDLRCPSRPCSPGGARRGCAATSVPDLVLDAVIGDDATHAVAGLPGEDGSVDPPGGARGAARRRCDRLRLRVPAPGDPVGLGGPPALQRGRPRRRRGRRRVAGAASAWCRRGSARRSSGRRSRRGRARSPDVGEADRELRSALLDAAEPAGRAGRRPLAPGGRRRADEPAAPAPGRRPARHPRPLPRPGRARPAGDDDRRPRPRRRRRRRERARDRAAPGGAASRSTGPGAGRSSPPCSPEAWPPADARASGG